MSSNSSYFLCAGMGVSFFCESVFGRLLFVFLLKTNTEIRPCLVKIISLKSGNCVLTLRKRRFCNAKQPLLPCKTYAFGMQNNRFCKALIYKLLCNSYVCEKYLHNYRLFSVHKASCLCLIFVLFRNIRCTFEAEFVAYKL